MWCCFPLIQCKGLAGRFCNTTYCIRGVHRGLNALQALGPNLDGSVVTNQVLPVLTMLSEDSDADVQFFAIQAMAGFTP